MFFYKDSVFGGILPLDHATKADFQVHQTRDGSGELRVRIEFFAPDSKDKLLGEVCVSFPLVRRWRLLTRQACSSMV